MRQLPTSCLQPGPTPNPIFHTSGEQLFPQGAWIQSEEIEALKKAEIRNVILLEPLDNLRDFKFKQTYKKTALDEVPIGQVTPSSVYTKEGTLLLNAGVKITESTIKRLKLRNIDAIYMRHSDSVLQKKQLSHYRSLLSTQKESQKITTADVVFDLDRMTQSKSITKHNIDHLIQSSETKVQNDGEPFITHILPTNPYTLRSDTLKDNFITTQQRSLENVRDIFNRIAHNKTVSPRALEKIIGEIVGGLIKDRELLCNLSHFEFAEEDYLFNHSLNVMIFSIHIGVQLGYNKGQLIELAHGALLADVGMIRVPDEIIFKEQELTSNERSIIRRHPTESINLLHKISHLPFTTPFIAYQSHERHNGRGYPNGRKSQTTHDFAKIVAIADIYDALTSNRPYRKKLTPYRAMEGVLKMCGLRAIEEKFMRAFIDATSMFPIGSYVALEDNKIAKVLAATTQMTKPIVRLLIDNGQTVDETITLDLSQPGSPKVVRSIDATHLPQFKDVMFGF